MSSLVEGESRRMGDTRERILEEAEKLYHGGGYDNISLQEVAEALGIKKPALFYHYKNKQELFYAMLRTMLERMRLQLAETIAASEPTAEAQLLAVLNRMTREPGFDIMHFLRQDYELLTQAQRDDLHVVWNESLFLPLHRIFQEGTARNEFKIHNSIMATFTFLNLWTLLPRVDNPMSQHRLEGVNSQAYNQDLLHLFLNGVR